MPDRDPRTEPRPGDVLEVVRKCIDCTRKFRRTVTQITPVATINGRHVEHGSHFWVVYISGNGEPNAVLSRQWAHWAANAEVISKA